MNKSRRLFCVALAIAVVLLGGCASAKSEPNPPTTRGQPSGSQSAPEQEQGVATTAAETPVEEPTTTAQESEADDAEDPAAAAFNKATVKSRGAKWLKEFERVGAGWSRSKIKKTLGAPSKTYRMDSISALGETEEAACLAYVVGKGPHGAKRWKFVKVDPASNLFMSKGNMEGTIKVSGNTTKYDVSFSSIEY